MRYVWIVDIIILAFLAWRLYVGHRDGIVRMLAGLAALAGGIVGGKFFTIFVAPTVETRYVRPWVDKLLADKQFSLGITDVAKHLSELLESVKLPAAFMDSVAEQVTEKLTKAGEDLLASASEIISNRIAVYASAVVGFILFFIMVYVALLLISSTLMKLPILKQTDQILGMIASGLTALLLCAVVLLVVYKLFPSLHHEGAIFAPENMKFSFVCRFLLMLFPRAMS